jgi:hypothetical protein
MATPHKIISIQVSGGEQLRARLSAWMEKAPEKVLEAEKIVMESVMEEAKYECPWDYNNPHNDGTPHLRETGAVAQVLEGDMSSDGMTSQIITYGSFATPYAVYVHEILENHHIPPTKAKFLEDPANRHAAVYLTELTRAFGDLYENE